MAERGVRPFEPVRWENNGLTFLDTRFLPNETRYVRANDVESVIDAVTCGAIAGARCVDLVTAFGVVLARRLDPTPANVERAVLALRAAADGPASQHHGVARIAASMPETELDQALAMLAETQRIDRSIARHTAHLLPVSGTLLTLGSTGSVSTGGYGTALGALVSAHAIGRKPRIYVCETRPHLTGLRLAAPELQAAGVASTVIPDGSAAVIMQHMSPGAIVVGAAAVAANGDILAESGTYSVAIAAAFHRIPFYVALPRAAVDFRVSCGTDFRLAHNADADAHELWDVTPGRLIAAMITEFGVLRPPYPQSLSTLATRPRFAAIDRLERQSSG